MALRTDREEGVKGIPKVDSAWISRGREKESKGAGGWSSFPEMGSLQEAWVWDVCLECIEITLKTTGEPNGPWREKREERRCVRTRVTLSSDSARLPLPPSLITRIKVPTTICGEN